MCLQEHQKNGPRTVYWNVILIQWTKKHDYQLQHNCKNMTRKSQEFTSLLKAALFALIFTDLIVLRQFCLTLFEKSNFKEKQSQSLYLLRCFCWPANFYFSCTLQLLTSSFKVGCTAVNFFVCFTVPSWNFHVSAIMCLKKRVISWQVALFCPKLFFKKQINWRGQIV